jgi:hypothetical protein
LIRSLAIDVQAPDVILSARLSGLSQVEEIGQEAGRRNEFREMAVWFK